MGQRWMKRIAIILVWLVVWQMAAVAIGNPMLFCGPIEVVFALAEAVRTATFWVSIVWSFVRIGVGFLCALVLGCVLGAIASRFALLAEMLAPLINVVKSAPVVCIIALLLVLVGSHVTTSLVVGMVVFPPIYAAMMEAAANRDRGLDELASVFRVRPFSRIVLIELPQYAPFLRAALKTAVAMSWKAGVAAEIIGLPGSSIGEAVYLSKLTLDVAMIISWTAVVIILGWLCEKAFIAMFDKLCDVPGALIDRRVRRALGRVSGAREEFDPGCHPISGSPPDLIQDAKPVASCGALVAERLDKSFDGQTVLSSIHLQVDPGARACLMAPSGAGKTTLLRMFSGLDAPDRGDLSSAEDISVVFQDDRLIDGFTASQNLAITAHDAYELETAHRLLCSLIPDESSWREKRAGDLSGGMKRRVQIARALAHRSCAVLMDEPFSGLDDATKRSVARIVLGALDGRTLLVATHDEDDAALLDASIIELKSS